MSELNSFFAKIHIKKDKFYEFLTAQPSQQLLNENWIAWWGSKEMYGKHELTQEQIYIYSAPTNGEIINGWKTYEQSLTFSDYDEENEIWNFSTIPAILIASSTSPPRLSSSMPTIIPLYR